MCRIESYVFSFKRDFGQPAALRDAQRALGVGDRQIVGDAGEMAGAVGRAAGARGIQFGVRVGQADDQHAVVQERQHHRQQRRLLAAVQAAGRGEDAGGLAGERALQPERRRCRRGNASAARPCCRSASGCRARGRRIPRDRGFRNRAVLAPGSGKLPVETRRNPGNRAQARLRARHALHAFGDQLGHAPHRAAGAVVEDENRRPCLYHSAPMMNRAFPAASA